MTGGPAGIRTRTSSRGEGILSPLRLPFRHWPKQGLASVPQYRFSAVQRGLQQPFPDSSPQRPCSAVPHSHVRRARRPSPACVRKSPCVRATPLLRSVSHAHLGQVHFRLSTRTPEPAQEGKRWNVNSQQKCPVWDDHYGRFRRGPADMPRLHPSRCGRTQTATPVRTTAPSPALRADPFFGTGQSMRLLSSGVPAHPCR